MLRLFSAVNLPGCIFFGKLQQLALRKNDCDNACHSIGPISTGAEWGGAGSVVGRSPPQMAGNFKKIQVGEIL